jgi:uncharacterized protein with HEPN domain
VTKDDRLYLVFIMECIERIEQYTHEGRDAFLANEMVQDAVLRKLHVLSESTQRLSETLRNQHPEVDWRVISAFRNVVVHDYLGIDLQPIWDIVHDDLPDLKQKIAAIQAELDQ